MLDFWQSAAQALRSHGRLYLAMVVANRKGSPGTPASRMHLSPDGTQQGTIGGGIMEKNAVTQGLNYLQSGLDQPIIETLQHHHNNRDHASGLICGGAQSNLHTVLTADQHLPLLQQIADIEQHNHPATLHISPHGFSIEKQNQPASYHTLYQQTGSTWTVSINLFNRRCIAIFGAGHCGVALAQVMHSLHYRVHLLESRDTPFTAIKAQAIAQLHCGPIAENITQLTHPAHTFVVVMTHSYPTDIDALSHTLPQHFPFIGLMGSQQKIVKILDTLQQKGFSPDQIKKIRAPIGLKIDSDTPEEIAISVAAQILLEREKLGL